MNNCLDCGQEMMPIISEKTDYGFLEISFCSYCTYEENNRLEENYLAIYEDFINQLIVKGE